jgi:hypothetical protein
VGIIATLHKRKGAGGKAREVACGDLCVIYAAPYPHAQESAMHHVEGVAKNGPCTSKRTQNYNLTTKQRLHRKPSCAVLEISTSQKDRESRIQKHQPNNPETTNNGSDPGNHS